MTIWKTPSKAKSTLLIFLLLGNEIVDCSMELANGRQLRGKIDLKKTNEVVSSSLFDNVMRASWSKSRAGSAFGSMGSHLAQTKADVVSRADLHAPQSRRLQAKSFLPRRPFPSIVPQLQKSFYKGSYFLKDFPNYHHRRQGSQVLSALQRTGVSSMVGEIAARQNTTTVVRQNPTIVTASLFGLGPAELLVVGAAALLLFGPSSLPGIGKKLGASVRELGGAVKEFQEEIKTETNATATDSPST